MRATEMETLQDELLESLTVNEKGCEENIRTFRSEINKFLDNIEERTISEFKHRCAAQKTALTDRKAVCRSIKVKLDADYKTSTDIRNGNGPRDIFIQTLRLSKTLAVYRAAVNDVKSETIFKEMSFEKDTILLDMQLHAKNLGFVKEETSRQASHDSFLNANLEKLNVFSLEARASGMCLINGNVILSNNSALSLLDSNFKIAETIKLTGSPRNITGISDTEVLCSLTYDKHFQFVEVYPKMKLKSCISLTKNCHGIKYFEGQIFVCCCDDNSAEVQILTKDGIIQRTVCLKKSGNKESLMNDVNCLGLNKNGSRLYVSEFGTRTLACMKTNGDIIFTYNGPDIQKPRGIILDDNDNLVVCDQASSLKVFKSDGSFYRHLRGVKNPLWLAWRKTDNILIVCNGNQLHTYALKFD